MNEEQLPITSMGRRIFNLDIALNSSSYSELQAGRYIVIKFIPAEHISPGDVLQVNFKSKIEITYT